MATDIHTACTRGRRGLQTAAALTVFFFGAAQAQAQSAGAPPVPPTAPAPPSSPGPSTSPGPRTAPGPSTAPGPRTTPGPATPPGPRVTPPTSATPAPTAEDRSLDAEIPTSIEGPESVEPPQPAEPPAPAEPAPPPAEAAPADAPLEPPPAPAAVGPAPPPAPAAPASDGNLFVKDQKQAQDLRRKGLAVLATGGIITLAGVATSIAFTVRGTQFENLLVQTEEEYNRSDCSSKAVISEGSKCEKLGQQRARNREGIEFGDRATRAAGAAIAAGVVVTVVGGIIYRLGINKLRSGDIARMRVQPAFGRNFNGLVLTGRF